MIFANADPTLGFLIVLAILLAGVFGKIWMVIYRPDVVKAELEEKRHRREQRNKLLGPVVGTGAKAFGWWLFRR